MCWEQKLIILKLPTEIDVKGYVPYPLVVSHKLGKLTVEFLKKNSSGCNWLKPFFLLIESEFNDFSTWEIYDKKPDLYMVLHKNTSIKI